VLRNFPEVEREIDFERINEVLKRSPGTARWMANPENAKVAWDDVGALTGIGTLLASAVEFASRPAGELRKRQNG
jgi:hypothetical protein